MYFIIIALLVALDQFSKYIVQSHMSIGESIPVFDDLFYLTYIHNYGAAFSILQDFRALLIAFPFVVTIVVLGLIIKLRKRSHRMLLWSLALIAGGGIGNLIDRIAYGYVVDFLDWRMWPIFNVADICVCIGCALLIFYIIIVEPKLIKQRENRNE